ncbi:MAG: hypothetical protein KBC64_03245 [Simkaniaceae bacterium]|nr:hypothetical protein [Simkaniaceae bacterium]
MRITHSGAAAPQFPLNEEEGSIDRVVTVAALVCIVSAMALYYIVSTSFPSD